MGKPTKASTIGRLLAEINMGIHGVLFHESRIRFMATVDWIYYNFHVFIGFFMFGFAVLETLSLV